MYSVPDLLTKVHSWPRFNAADGMRTVSNIFNPDWQTDAGKSYMEGVLSLAGVYFALGIVFFLAFTAVGLLALCCRTRRDTTKEHSGCGSFCRLVFGPRVWYVLALIALVGVSAAAIQQVTAFRNMVNDSVDTLDRLDGLLTNTSTLVGNQLVPNLQSMQTTLGNLRTEAANNNNNILVQVVDNMLTNTGSAITTTSKAATDLNTTASSLNDKLHNGDTNVNDLGQKVFIGGVAALGCFLGFLLISGLGLIKSPCCATYFRVCNVFLVLAILLVYIFTGLFMAVSIVSSDVCVDPSGAITRITDLANPGADSINTLQFYTTCGNGTNVAPVGAYASALNSSALLDNMVYYLDQANGAYGNDPNYSPYFTTLYSDVGTTNSTLQSVLGAVSCAPVYGLYTDMLNALCTTGAVAVVTVWALGTAACVIIFILVTSGARLCWRHPGDETDDGHNTRAGAVFAQNAAYAAPLTQPGASYQRAPSSTGYLHAPSSSAGVATGSPVGYAQPAAWK